jgi:hypothetical protein
MQSKPRKLTLRRLIDEINTDKDVRADFLKDPARMLKNCGIVMPTKTQRELRQIIADYQKKFPRLRDPPDGDEDPYKGTVAMI